VDQQIVSQHAPARDEIDIHRSAKRLIDLFGTNAAVEAALRADAMIERGDMDGAGIWRSIVRVIAEIQSIEGRTP
jgi:hypothetical protein